MKHDAVIPNYVRAGDKLYVPKRWYFPDVAALLCAFGSLVFSLAASPPLVMTILDRDDVRDTMSGHTAYLMEATLPVASYLLAVVVTTWICRSRHRVGIALTIPAMIISALGCLFEAITHFAGGPQ